MPMGYLRSVIMAMPILVQSYEKSIYPINFFRKICGMKLYASTIGIGGIVAVTDMVAGS
jgi:hypothetical protein